MAEMVADKHASLRCEQCGKARRVRQRHLWVWRRERSICDICWSWISAAAGGR